MNSALIGSIILLYCTRILQTAASVKRGALVSPLVFSPNRTQNPTFNVFYLWTFPLLLSQLSLSYEKTAELKCHPPLLDHGWDNKGSCFHQYGSVSHVFSTVWGATLIFLMEREYLFWLCVGEHRGGKGLNFSLLLVQHFAHMSTFGFITLMQPLHQVLVHNNLQHVNWREEFWSWRLMTLIDSLF